MCTQKTKKKLHHFGARLAYTKTQSSFLHGAGMERPKISALRGTGNYVSLEFVLPLTSGSAGFTGNFPGYRN